MSVVLDESSVVCTFTENAAVNGGFQRSTVEVGRQSYEYVGRAANTGTVQLVSNAQINHSVQRAAKRPSRLTDRDREGWCSTEATPGTGETGGDVEIKIKYRDKKVPQETHTLDPPRGIPVCNRLPVPVPGNASVLEYRSVRSR